MDSVMLGQKVKLKRTTNDGLIRVGTVLTVKTFTTPSKNVFYSEEYHGRPFLVIEVEPVTEADSDFSDFAVNDRLRVFPQQRKAESGQPVINTVVEFPIDPRVWLAGMVAQGYLAGAMSDGSVIHYPKDFEKITEVAVGLADSLLERLRRK